MLKTIVIVVVVVIAGILIYAATKPVNMDKMIGNDFATGLANLKTVAEEQG